MNYMLILNVWFSQPSSGKQNEKCVQNIATVTMKHVHRADNKGHDTSRVITYLTHPSYILIHIICKEILASFRTGVITIAGASLLS